MLSIINRAFRLHNLLLTKVKKIYLIRHGQTEYNKQKIVQGSGVDSDLNDLGKSQAQAFFRYYKTVPFDKIYTSCLKRSIQSVQAFLDLGIPHEPHAGLNEINWGHKEGQRITPEGDVYYHQLLEQWRQGSVHIPIKGGESPQTVQDRQKPVLDLILSRPEEKNILICMHGRAMRIFLCLMLHYPIAEMDWFEHENLCLYKLTYTGSLFTIDAFCDTEHLKQPDTFD